MPDPRSRARKTPDASRLTPEAWGGAAPVSGVGRGASRIGRLFRDTDGQVLLAGIIVVAALLAFLLAIPGGTQVTTAKMRAQNAADAGAFTGSVWLARSLNLNANLNVGISRMCTWMTVLTAAEALALALYSDTADASVMATGRDMTLALFGNSNPVYTATQVYPQSIQKLAETARWLYDLQTDIAGSFPVVAQALGAEQARRNAGAGDPASSNPGGTVLVRAADSLPFVADTAGDRLLHADLARLAASLENIPTNDPNIGPATGRITVDSADLEVTAWYGDSSQWCDVRQVLARFYKKYIRQTFRNTTTGVYDTGYAYFDKPGGSRYTAYLQGDSWVTPFHNPPWTLTDCHPGDNRYKRDTVVIKRRVVKRTDPRYGSWNYHPWSTGDSILPGAQIYVNNGDIVDSSIAYPTDFYTGAESTNGNQGARVRLRRLNPEVRFAAVAYVWWLGGSQSPFGPGPAVGKLLFPRGGVAAPCPMLAVARAEPYLALTNPTAEDLFFSPDWDARLAPLDSAAVHAICADTAYAGHSLGAIDLDGLRRYVLLP